MGLKNIRANHHCLLLFAGSSPICRCMLKGAALAPDVVRNVRPTATFRVNGRRPFQIVSARRRVVSSAVLYPALHGQVAPARTTDRSAIAHSNRGARREAST